MQYFIKANSNAKYGYELVIKDNNSEIVKELTSKTTDNYLRVNLPELNIKMIALKTIEANMQDGIYMLTAREAKARASSASDRKAHVVAQWLDYLNDDEKAIVEEIKAKALARAKKMLLEKQIAEMQAQLDALDD